MIELEVKQADTAKIFKSSLELRTDFLRRSVGMTGQEVLRRLDIRRRAPYCSDNVFKFDQPGKNNKIQHRQT